MKRSGTNDLAYLKVLLYALFIVTVACTIDMNLPEFQYLADHLHPEECRKLIAALHYSSYDMPNALDHAERKISKDVSCLKQLLHWNSARGEGKGETHEVIEHRLRQLNRLDLADWVGKTVFHELAMDLEHSLNSPFDELSNTDNKTEVSLEFTTEALKYDDPSEWSAVDTIAWTICLILLAIILMLIVKLCRDKCGIKEKHINVKPNTYLRLNNTKTDTSSDSDDIFDIRTKLN